MTTAVYVPKRVYNLKPEKLSHVPKVTSFGSFKLGAALPSKVDLRSKCPPIYDQGQLGSCVANALCATFGFDDPKFNGSRLFLYFNCRAIDGNIDDDSGTTISTGIQAMAKYGLCSERCWPYNIDKFTKKPSKSCYSEGLKHKIVTYQHVAQNKDSIKSCLASGFPIALGIMVYPGLESDVAAQTGYVPMPSEGDQLLGGHAILCVGYDDSKQVWIMRNSWGTGWGDKGYFYLPYGYLVDGFLTSDLWKVTKVEIPTANKQQSSDFHYTQNRFKISTRSSKQEDDDDRDEDQQEEEQESYESVSS